MPITITITTNPFYYFPEWYLLHVSVRLLITSPCLPTYWREWQDGCNWQTVILWHLCGSDLLLTLSYRYSNTLLVTLNNRIYFRDNPSLRQSIAGTGPSGHPSHRPPQVRPLGITITKDTITLDSFSSSTTDIEKAKNNTGFAVSTNLRPSL